MDKTRRSAAGEERMAQAIAKDMPRVVLVGAGPGDPGLLTLRAVQWLARADVVFHDRLVPLRLLDHAPQARRVCVEHVHPCPAERQSAVVAAMVEAARRGECVVRLKGGDPLVFGRGAEEAEQLRNAGIAFEIVPGVTAALGLACAGIPLTHRRFASAVALVTGHEQPDKPDSQLDWSALARFPGALVFYMGVKRLPNVVAQLLQHGKDPGTPAAAVRWASTGEQRTVEASLNGLVEAVQRSQLKSPALIVVGGAVGLRSELAWMESRPLFGKRILVTRPRHQAADWVRRLEDLGAVVSVLPTVEISEPSDWTPVDRAIRELSSYQWLVFTSVNGVYALIKRLRHLGRDLRALGSMRLAVIGPATADALRSYHLEPDLLPLQYNSESLAEALKVQAKGQRVLLARADRGRDLLRDELATVAAVEQVAVYSQKDCIEWDDATLAALKRGEFDLVTLTSSNIARALERRLDEPAREHVRRGRTQLVTISPVTSAAVRELQLPVAAEAAEYTMEGVTAALVACVGARKEKRLT
jgi:uroporphyrinogen III methyltransferase/synthase